MIYKKVTFFNVFYYAKITSDMETDIPECYKRLEYVRILYDKAMHHNIIVIQVSIQVIYIYNIRALSEEELEYTKKVIRIRK
jgi:hypothetical protein